MKVDPEPPPDSTDIANLTSYLRQIADELDYEAKCSPCSEAEIIRLAATEIERLRRDVAEMGVLVTRAIDNFLIDRVFQRCSSAVQETVETSLDASQVADPVAVAVLERTTVNLVTDAVLPPDGICHGLSSDHYAADLMAGGPPDAGGARL
jgi:hypothetical protein